MYGVVLWSDAKCDRALIWCEDHGKLAFFNGQPDRPDTLEAIEAGDLVKLELEETRDFRLAKDVELVSSDEYPQLADTLLEVGENFLPEAMQQARGPESNVIPFGRPQPMAKSETDSKKSALPGS